jgi:hypothetical protein
MLIFGNICWVTLVDFGYHVEALLVFWLRITFKLYWLSNLITLSVPEESYIGSVSCALNKISTFLSIKQLNYLPIQVLTFYYSIACSRYDSRMLFFDNYFLSVGKSTICTITVKFYLGKPYAKTEKIFF